MLCVPFQRNCIGTIPIPQENTLQLSANRCPVLVLRLAVLVMVIADVLENHSYSSGVREIIR